MSNAKDAIKESLSPGLKKIELKRSTTDVNGRKKKKIASKKVENLSLIRDFLFDERMKQFLNYSSESEVKYKTIFKSDFNLNFL